MLLGASFLARLPLGMAGVLVLLHVLSRTGSGAVGGAATACYGVAYCGAAPGWGRLADRRGPRAALRPAAGAFFGASVLLAICPRQAELLCVASALLGGCAPPLNAVMRQVWQKRLPDEEARRSAAALESVMGELVHIMGRISVAVVVLVASTAGGLLVQGVLCAGANQWLLAQRDAFLNPEEVPSRDAASRRPGCRRFRDDRQIIRPLLEAPQLYFSISLLSASLGATGTGLSVS